MPLVTERLTLAQYLIALRRAQGFEIAQASPALVAGKNVMEEIRLLQNKMVAEIGRAHV